MDKNKKKKTGKFYVSISIWIVLICLVLSAMLIFILPRIIDLPVALEKTGIYSLLDRLGVSRQDLNAVRIPFLNNRMSFKKLPDANKSVVDQSGTWTAFLNPNGAISLSQKDGILWAAPGQGLVAWNVSTGEYQHYTTFDGLVTNSINQAVVYGDGKLFATTEDAGIIYFDGEYWQVIDLPELSQVLLMDAQGGLWFSNSTGEVLYRFFDNAWTTFPVREEIGAIGISRAMSCPDGRVYFQGNSILRFQDGIIIDLNLNDSYNVDTLNLMTCSEKGDAYLVDTDNIIYIEINGKLHEGPSLGALNGQVDLAISNEKNQVFFSTVDVSENEQSNLYKLEDGIVMPLPYDGAKITALTSSRDGHIWAANNNEIIQFSNYTYEMALKDPLSVLPKNIYEICIDPDGSVWVAGGNIYHFSGNKWDMFSPMEEMDARQCSVSNTQIWFLNISRTSQLISYREGNWNLVTLDPKLGGEIYELSTSKNQVLLSTDQGIIEFDEGKNVFNALVKWNLPDLPARLNISSDNVTWLFIPGSGIYGIGENTLESYIANNYSFNIIDSTETNSELFMATVDGLNLYKNTGWSRAGGSPLSITDIFGNNSSLWLSSANMGIWEYDQNWITHISRSNSAVPYGPVRKIAVDNNNALWLNVNGGLFVFEPDPDFRSLLGSDEALQSAIELGRDNVYYFPLIHN